MTSFPPPIVFPLSLPPPRSGIPTLILLDAEGHLITRQGRVEVLNDPECRLFPWHPRPVLELSESNAVQLHEGPCLVLFVGKQSLKSPNCFINDLDLSSGSCMFHFSFHSHI